MAALKSEKPELILLDVMLPGKDGIEILKYMKERIEYQRIPVIMATARGEEYDRIKGLDLGADDYIVKPFSMMEMVSRVKAVSLHVLSKEICETLSDAAKKKGISLELAGEEGVVLGVRRLLYEIIYNLCDNAIKYNKQDGKVRISIEEQTEEVCIKVQDTGIGIASEEQDWDYPL